MPRTQTPKETTEVEQLLDDIHGALKEAADLAGNYREKIINGDKGLHLQHIRSELGWASMKLQELRDTLSMNSSK